jgi:hypothetical protein
LNCFEIAKKVLDRSFAKIEGSQEEKVKLINKRISELQTAYGNLDQKDRVDYSDPITQFAYIYKYTTAHASYVCTLMEKADRKDALPTEGKIKLASIGGGPGSDFLGFLKFYNSSCYSGISAISNSFDKDSDWSYCWSKVFEEARECTEGEEACSSLSTNFHILDVCDPKSTQRIDDYTDSDIFTMIYFMSEVYQFRDKVAPFFTYLFSNIRKGATVLFIDNKTDRYREWFDFFVGANGYEVLISGEDRWVPSFDEQKAVLGEYLTLLKQNPKLQGDIAYRVVRKM